MNPQDWTHDSSKLQLNVGLGQSSNLSFKRALPDLNKETGNTPYKRTYNTGRGRGFSSHHKPTNQGAGRGRGAYNNNNHWRFGAVGSSAIQPHAHRGARTSTYVPNHPREFRSQNSEIQNGTEGSSWGSNTSAISSPAFGRSINWDWKPDTLNLVCNRSSSYLSRFTKDCPGYFRQRHAK